MTAPRVLVTTVPFADNDRTPLDLLASCGAEVVINPLGRKLKETELAEMAAGFHILVAGTEPITERVMDNASQLKLIARVGIGLDSVDLLAARQRGIAVSYTPDAPSAAVAELSVGLMIDMLRNVSGADRDLRRGHWHRFMGRRLSTCTIGVVGVGRIGQRVIRHLVRGFEGVRILANDIAPDLEFGAEFGVTWVEKDDLYAQSDVVSLHLPLSPLTLGLIAAPELERLKPGAVIVNTARGGIVDETALYAALKEKRLAAAAVDVFETEPYDGPLGELDNCVLTCHMGSMSRDCRVRMEVEACKEACRFILGQALASPVPEAEYLVAERLKAARR